MRMRASLWLYAWVAAMVLAGCSTARPTTIPMKTLFDAAPASAGSKALLVIMPGMRDTPEDLVRQGFIRAVRERGIAADIVIVDAHFGYFQDRSFERRLREDVIKPARARGYASIWLSGISLGGFGSLLYASRQPQDVDGLITLAPFIASERVVEEVLAAGGLAHWSAQPGRKEEENVQRALLTWLKGYLEPADFRPPLYIGYGATDRFAPVNAQVASLLPAAQSLVVPGGHSWAAWVPLWEQILERVPLPGKSLRADAADH